MPATYRRLNRVRRTNPPRIGETAPNELTAVQEIGANEATADQEASPYEATPLPENAPNEPNPGGPAVIDVTSEDPLLQELEQLRKKRDDLLQSMSPEARKYAALISAEIRACRGGKIPKNRSRFMSDAKRTRTPPARPSRNT